MDTEVNFVLPWFLRDHRVRRYGSQCCVACQVRQSVQATKLYPNVVLEHIHMKGTSLEYSSFLRPIMLLCQEMEVVLENGC